MSRILTDAEANSFKWSHPLSYLFLQIPPEGRYLWDDNLMAWILIFPKSDGTTLFIQTDLTSDPTTTDPNQLAYVTQETLQAIGENAAAVGKALTPNSDLVLIVVMVLAIVFGIYLLTGFRKSLL